MSIWNVQTGRWVCHEVVEARSFWARTRGLIGRPALVPGEGMMIHRCQGVHMFFMRTPIDVVFLSRANEVVGLVPGLRPWRVTRFYSGADRALELPVGTIERAGVALGHRLEEGTSTRGEAPGSR